MFFYKSTSHNAWINLIGTYCIHKVKYEFQLLQLAWHLFLLIIITNLFINNLALTPSLGPIILDFVVLKIDMRNAFNLVTRDALLQEYANFFPELLPWASWCYSVQPLLWHPMGHLSSESGVQQGDPLGPLFFALVLHQIVSSIDADDECLHLLYQAWYLDDGVLAGTKSSVLPSFVFN